MKRTTKVEKEFRYEFIGPGSHVTGTGRVMKKGDRIRAFPSEIEPFKTKFRALEHVPEQSEEEEAQVEPESRLIPVHKGGGRYIVVQEETNETVTDGYLSRDDAYAMCGMDPSRASDTGPEDKEEEEEEKEEEPGE